MTTRILVGDVRERLAELPDESVHMVITSPPYWSMRSYNGEPGMIGLEPTFDEHLANLVEVFREVRRVLRDDGILFLNYGDAYAGGGRGFGSEDCKQRTNRGSLVEENAGWRTEHYKPKDLMGMPWRVAFALQHDGWWLRSEIIYHKTNPMPESATDRPTNTHEKLFLLSKSGDTLFWQHRDGRACRTRPEPDYIWVHKETKEESVDEVPGWRDKGNPWKRRNLWRGSDYFYDQVAVRVESSENTHPRRKDGRRSMAKGHDPNDRRGTWVEPPYGDQPPPWKALPSEGLRNRGERTPKDGDGRGARLGRGPGWRKRTEPPRHAQYETGHNGLDATPRGTRNLRNVWTMPTGAGFRGAHFATFPPELCETPIKAGTSKKGVCSACGAPWVRTVENHSTVGDWTGKGGRDGRLTSGNTRNSLGGEAEWLSFRPPSTIGWSPSCACDAEVVPATVLDPFAGAGTVGLVAEQLGRDAVLVEISREYAEMAQRRLADDLGGLFSPTIE